MGELAKKLPKMIDETVMQQMILPLMLMVVTKDGLREKDPETFYSIKSKVRGLIETTKKFSEDLGKELDGRSKRRA